MFCFIAKHFIFYFTYVFISSLINKMFIECMICVRHSFSYLSYICGNQSKNRKKRKTASFHRVYSNGEDIDNKATIKRKQNMLYVFNCYGEKYSGTVNKECSGEHLGLQFYIG